ncbi:MAG: magnesium chelatase [Anaerolineales bacterium]|nr:magnesium chelatase [Anaerolineae bacterium]PWB50943.1 MAG: magnesium chelatase [Anaerolineales bacterium]
MDNESSEQPGLPEDPIGTASKFPSLKALLAHTTGKDLVEAQSQPDSGLVESLPFPFLALVGQVEMKYALLLALINPAIGGVLLIGPRGTGKTTAIRGLVDLVPEIPRSLCFYGCMPEDIEAGGIDAVCPSCARKYAMGEPLAAMDKIRLVELPLNARIEDVVGATNETDLGTQRLRLQHGILSHADRNLLLVDEVNLLSDDVVDAILDAAAYGSYTVKRGTNTATYRSRFMLVGTMNPEEGRLRPQIMDRFGLRVVVRGLEDNHDRLEAYQRAQAFLKNPHKVIQEYKDETMIAQGEVQLARDILAEVCISELLYNQGLKLIKSLKIDSLRAEITMFEGMKALAALDNRKEVTVDDLQVIAPMALRMRRSQFIEKYLSEQSSEEDEINTAVDSTINDAK